MALFSCIADMRIKKVARLRELTPHIGVRRSQYAGSRNLPSVFNPVAVDCEETDN